MVGDTYTIVDMAVWGWARADAVHPRRGSLGQAAEPEAPGRRDQRPPGRRRAKRSRTSTPSRPRWTTRPARTCSRSSPARWRDDCPRAAGLPGTHLVLHSTPDCYAGLELSSPTIRVPCQGLLMHQKERLAALKCVPILADLSPTQLEQVAGSCRWKNYNADDQVLNYHDPSTDVFFLASGKVRVVIYSSEGKVVVFTDLRPGTMFGEIAAIDRRPRSAGVEAIKLSTIASLTASQFESLLLREPAVAVATLRHVTTEVRRLSERVLEFSTLVVQDRNPRRAPSAGGRRGTSQWAGLALSGPVPFRYRQPHQHASRGRLPRAEPAWLHRPPEARRRQPSDHRYRASREAGARSQRRIAHRWFLSPPG